MMTIEDVKAALEVNGRTWHIDPTLSSPLFEDDEERFGLTVAGALAIGAPTAMATYLVAPTTGVEWGGRMFRPIR